ncbi:LuxR C-terminal-related transcriptional regulator [Streptomyces sp. NPDC058701]|uniref:helix-turn-helix transcriptional regulator n=1 Tax=Streptomyces sp. NPDC058701 TaxID=3346608 RepID=UPI00365F8FC8
MVGRQAELGLFVSLLKDKHSHGLVISGGAGVGKSRLAEECLAKASAAGFAVARAAASSAAASVPLGAIAHLVPPGVSLSDPAIGFARMAEELRGAENRRWVVLVDDMHLLDATSAALLKFLMQDGAVRLVGTIRADEPVRDAVASVLQGDAVSRVHLPVLSEEQVATLLRNVLDGPVGSATVRQLFTSCNGNVLYLKEIVTGSLTAGTLASDGEVWELTERSFTGTPRLTELIESRLSGAGTAARPVLELLALCAPVPEQDVREASPSSGTLDELVEAGLVRITKDGNRSAAQLTHPLYGEILRARLPTLRRRSILTEQAARFRRHGARRRDDSLHIASWTLAATGTADSELLMRGAELSRYAHDYEQVVTLLSVVPPDELTVRSRILLSEAHAQAGRLENAEADLAEAESRAQSEEDRLAVALATTWNVHLPAGRVTEALAANERARAYVSTERGRRVLRVNEGAIRAASGRPADGLVLLEDLEADIRESLDVNVWVQGALTRTEVLALTGRSQQAVEWSETAHRSHLTVTESSLTPHPALHLAVRAAAQAESGGLGEARATALEAFRQVMDDTVDLPRAMVSLQLGRIEWLAGRVVTARRWYAEAAVLARAHGLTHVVPLACAGLAAAAAVQGDVASAERALGDSEEFPESRLFGVEPFLGAAWVNAARGRLTQARDVLTAGAEKVANKGLTTLEAVLLTESARLGGAATVARRLAELAPGDEGLFAAARAKFAEALAGGKPDLLMEASQDLEDAGAILLAAEAASAAAAGWTRLGRPHPTKSAAQRAKELSAQCEGARTPLLTTAEASAALTARETEIALLAGDGMSSKDIADALGLSVRTVDNHLQRVYNKLGVTTRRDLADALDLKRRGPGGRGARPRA